MQTKIIEILIGLSLLICVGCESNPRHQVTGGELSVFFYDAKHEKLATEVAQFWKDKELVTGNPQDLELLSDGVKGYSLGMIQSKKGNPAKMPFNELKLLLDLRNELDTTIFKGLNFDLVICNIQFEPIYVVK
ncbi:MAG: hypothetical protein MK066_11340 [Crocinitomicaceae bacterium]|nr:hypothetical protein [Crocinitomicaceae bacterium]